MLDRWGSGVRKPVVEAVSSGAELQALRSVLGDVHVAPAIKGYVLGLVRRTRELAQEEHEGARLLEFGASPRATLGLHQAARALALLRGEGYVTPALIQEVAADVLRHRVGLTYEAVASGMHPDAVVGLVLEQVEIPAP